MVGIDDGFVLEQAVVALTAPGGRVVVVVGVGVVVGAVVVALDLAVDVEVDVEPAATKTDVRCAGWLTPSPERAVVAGDDVVAGDFALPGVVVPGETFAGATVVDDADLGVVVVVEVEVPGAT